MLNLITMKSLVLLVFGKKIASLKKEKKMLSVESQAVHIVVVHILYV